MNSDWKPGQNKNKKTGRSFDQLDDALGDLLGGDDSPPPAKNAIRTTASSAARGSAMRTKGKSNHQDADFYSSMAAVSEEPSDFSDADPASLAKQLEDLDDMDAHLFGSGSLKKPLNKSGPVKKEATRPVSAPDTKKTVTFSPPNSPPKTAEYAATSPRRGSLKSQANLQEQVKKDVEEQLKAKTIDFGDIDEDDPLAGLLSDDEDIPKRKPAKKPVPTTSTPVSQEDNRPPTRSGPSQRTSPRTDQTPTQKDIEPERPKAAKKREEIIFSDNDDDVLGGMGLEDDEPKKVETVENKPARSVFDNLLKSDVASKHLQTSTKQEKRDFILDKKYLNKSQKEPEKKEMTEEDFTFGSYRPSSAASSRTGRNRTSQRADMAASLGFLDDAETKPMKQAGRSRGGLSSTLPDDFGGNSWLDMASESKPTNDSADTKPPKSPVTKPSSLTSPRSDDWLGLGNDVVVDTKHESTGSNWLGFASNSPQTAQRRASIAVEDPSSPKKQPPEQPRRMSIAEERPSSPQKKQPDFTPPAKPPAKLDLPAGFGDKKPEYFTGDLDLDGSVSKSLPIADTNDKLFEAPPNWEMNSLPWDTGSRKHRRELGTAGPLESTGLRPSSAGQRTPTKPSTPVHTNQSHDLTPSLTPGSPATAAAGPDVLVVQMQQQLQQQQLDLERQQQQWLSQQRQKQQEILKQQQMQMMEAQQRQHQLMLQSQMQLSSLPAATAQPMPLAAMGFSGMNTTQYTELETKIKRLELEKQHIQSLLDSSKQQHNDEIAALQDAHKKQMQLTEDTFSRRERRLKEESDQLIQQNTDRLKKMENERSELVLSHQQKQEEWMMEKQRETERIREQNRLTIEDMKKDHDAMIERIKKAKDQELEAVTNVQSHTRSLQFVMDKIESNTRNLGDLSLKVGTQHVNNLDERELYITNKEEEVKRLRDQLQKQQEENERERNRLQDLISKMELQMREQSKQLEAERWKTKQEQNKLDSMQMALEEEKRMVLEQLSRERQDVQRAKDNILAEQKQAMVQLYQERRELAEEKTQFAVQQRMFDEKTQKGAVRSMQADVEYEAAVKSIADERSKLTITSDELKREKTRLIAEKSDLEKQQRSLNEEKTRLTALADQMKSRSEEVEKMAETAAHTRDEGQQALALSRKIEAEQAGRLQTIQSQLTALHSKEKQIAQERLNLAKEMREIEDARHSMLCTACKSSLHNQTPLSQGVQGSQNKSNGLVGMNGAWSVIDQTQSVHIGGQYLSRTIELDRALRIWEIEAEKDKHFLDDQEVFLEAIKRAPYHKQP
ncbi:fas-binding factor 1 homolog [Tubulanus polymorphus]|uniref:fas-binding factor 1 homolog n=1 Tax=Tubulanus polymorphus TaxID=672921 RepID=UPI003DA56DF9